MYSIGQIAMILGISTRTLRYYDEIGILIPKYIKGENGYRFYEEWQIADVKKIMKLKNAGLSLEEIKEITEKADDRRFINIIENRAKIIEKQINELKEMMANLNILKEYKEIIGTVEKTNFTVKIVEIPENTVIEKNVIINLKEVGKVVGELYEEIAKKRLVPIGNHVIKYNNTEYDPENSDISIFIPIDSNSTKNNEYKNFNGGEYISVIANSISERELAYRHLIDWINANNINAELTPIERYSMKEGKFNIEILYKIKK
ncbi:MAG: MerR family transcriptional regulator [Fusobacteriaceae bacterium]|nr:MerR family transcriptional regulator [Fusobacteriaceae bacterium]